MRSTIEIVVAVTEGGPASDEELRLAVLVLKAIDHFSCREVRTLVEAIDAGTKPGFLKIRAIYAIEWLERRFAAVKTDPVEWLGPDGAPGNADYDRRVRTAKAAAKKATGLDL